MEARLSLGAEFRVNVEARLSLSAEFGVNVEARLSLSAEFRVNVEARGRFGVEFRGFCFDSSQFLVSVSLPSLLRGQQMATDWWVGWLQRWILVNATGAGAPHVDRQFELRS